MFLDFWFFNGFWLENDFIRLTAKNSFFAYGLTKSVKGSGKSSFLRSWVLICDWWISMRFVCFCVSRFVACDRNYHWRQRKTQLWRRLLNFRVRMFVKSAVKHAPGQLILQYTPSIKMLRHLLQMPWYFAYHSVTPYNSGASRDVFLIPKISYIITHCKFVSQGACIFLKKTQNDMFFSNRNKKPDEEKNYRWTEFFSQVGQ